MKQYTPNIYRIAQFEQNIVTVPVNPVTGDYIAFFANAPERCRVAHDEGNAVFALLKTLALDAPQAEEEAGKEDAAPIEAVGNLPPEPPTKERKKRGPYKYTKKPGNPGLAKTPSIPQSLMQAEAVALLKGEVRWNASVDGTPLGIDLAYEPGAFPHPSNTRVQMNGKVYRVGRVRGQAFDLTSEASEECAVPVGSYTGEWRK